MISITGTNNSPDILTLARQQGGNYFVDLLWATGLAEDLIASSDHHTLIIPTDRVFKDLSQELRNKMRDTCYLREILRHHIVKGVNKFSGSSPNRVLLTMQKTPVIYNNFKDQVRHHIIHACTFVSQGSVRSSISEARVKRKFD